MISRIHQKLGTAGFIISIVALVAALGGGAYAASGGLTGKQKKEVEKIAKKYAGKPGKNGAAGSVGATGPMGPAGTKGENGAPGANGVGTNGTNGKSVVLVNEEPEECPNEEGFTYKIEGSTALNEVCSATGGGGGGLPKTLGAEETETGVYATGLVETGETTFVPISFTIPLGAELDETHVKIVKKGETAPAECTFGTGTPSASNPQAKPGYLCVFEGEYFEPGGEIPLQNIRKPNALGAVGAATAGATLELFAEKATPNQISGTWAVTGAL
jgi:hypothetical protein